jgi:hypothetical protein
VEALEVARVEYAAPLVRSQQGRRSGGLAASCEDPLAAPAPQAARRWRGKEGGFGRRGTATRQRAVAGCGLHDPSRGEELPEGIAEGRVAQTTRAAELAPGDRRGEGREDLRDVLEARGGARGLARVAAVRRVDEVEGERVPAGTGLEDEAVVAGGSAMFDGETQAGAVAAQIEVGAQGAGAYSATNDLGDVALSFFDPFPGFSTGQFVGFISDTPFSAVTIAAPGGFTTMPWTI